MQMGRNRLPLSCMLFALIALTLFEKSCTAEGEDTLSLSASLRGNQILVSKNGTFELGFFSPDGTDNWYIGIWYGKVAEKTIVWVANREAPAKKSPGVLKLSREAGLEVFDAEGASLWSLNMPNNSSRAVILDSGNFLVLAGDGNSTVWQSFDHPVDTWLPGMKIGGERKLVCWNNSWDPAPGHFSFQQDPSGIRQFVLIWNNSVQYWESGAWDGKRLSGVPEMWLTGLYNYSVENTSSGLNLSYTLTPDKSKHTLSRFVLLQSGQLQDFILPDNNKWSVFWSRPRDQCTVYNVCGAFGTCNSNNIQFCSCVKGFAPRDNRSWSSQDWSSSGCVRQSPLDCEVQNGGSTDGFIDANVTLPNHQASSYSAHTQKDCEQACLGNCQCTAFSFDPSSGGCRIWYGDLLNMQSSPSQSNSNFFIRVAASELPKIDMPSSSSSKAPIFVGAGLGALSLALGIFSFLRWRSQGLQSTARYVDSSNSFLRTFSYKELKIATRNFSSKLGGGGFGSVFKGSLVDGTLVAVKKLEGSSPDEKQFRAEIDSIGKIQHVNLVRLRGFCAQGVRRFLVYELMPNGSLNSALFRKKGKGLDWKTRCKIALGTARGLLYLHEECRERIIHNDVKPENILLDDEFSPKLADFGLAKIVDRDFSRVLTTARGTRGYIAPEWFSGLPITCKVDVYSFGITLLEIISGRRNVEMGEQESERRYLPRWVAAQIHEGKVMNILDESVKVAEEAEMEEVRRALVVGLLCIEEDENVRPSMGQVVRMLEGNMEPPLPQIPRDTNHDDVISIFRSLSEYAKIQVLDYELNTSC